MKVDRVSVLAINLPLMYIWIPNWTQWVSQGENHYHILKRNERHLHYLFIWIQNVSLHFIIVLWDFQRTWCYSFKASIQIIIKSSFYCLSFFKGCIWVSRELHVILESKICSWELLSWTLPIEPKTKLLCISNYGRKIIAHLHFLPNNFWNAPQSYWYLAVERIFKDGIGCSLNGWLFPHDLLLPEYP